MEPFLEDVAPERRIKLFRDVMAGIGKQFDTWGTFNGHQLLMLDILGDAGVVIEPLPASLESSQGFSFWTTAPTMVIQPRLFEQGDLNRTLLHELYHLVGPLAEGLNFDRDSESRPVNELLADRFAAEVLCPLPMIAHHAFNTPLAQWPGELVPIEQAVRVTRRPMFVVKVDTSGRDRSTPSSVMQVVCQFRDVFQIDSESLEVLGSVAVHSESYRTRRVFGDSSENTPGWLLSRDGMAYRLMDHELVSQSLNAAGVLENLKAQPARSSYARWYIPFQLLHGFMPFGGAWFVVRSFHDPVAPKMKGQREPDCTVIGVQDRDGFLAGAHSEFRFGTQEMLPTLPIEDPLAYRQPESFEDWTNNIREAFLNRPSSRFRTPYTRGRSSK